MFVRKILCSLIVLAGLFACEIGITDPYGVTGWKDSEDWTSVKTVNPDGDTLNALRLGLFGEEIFIYTLTLEDTAFRGTCETSEGKTNEQGLTKFSTLVTFDFPENHDLSFDLSAALVLGSHQDSGVEKAVIIFIGEQLLPKIAIDSFTSMNKLDISITDDCGKLHDKHSFNISGDLREMLATLDQRKRDAQEKEVNEEFR